MVTGLSTEEQVPRSMAAALVQGTVAYQTVATTSLQPPLPLNFALELESVPSAHQT